MTCRICGQTRDASAFYACNKSVCRECYKARVRSNYRAAVDDRHAYDLTRMQTQKRKQHNTNAAKKHRAKYPERYAARTAVQNALRRGDLIRQPCEKCGTGERVEAHHEDYARPLDVRWMCRSCHRAEHGALVTVP